MNIKSDKLWDRMREGDDKALHQIYEEHIAYLYNYGKKISPKSVLVEDGIHDLFVQIWSTRDRIGSTDNIRPYLASSLRRMLIRQMTKDQKIQEVDENDNISFATTSSIEDWIVENESQEEKSLQLKKAYTSLTDKQREIIYLRYHQNMDYEEIADILGVKYQSLRNLLSTAVGGMRAAMLSFSVICCLLVSCTSEVEETFIEPSIAPYFLSFVSEAKNRGVNIEDSFNDINAEFALVNEASGQCVTSTSGVRTIKVDPTYWKRVSNLKKEFLIFHELGHCYLGFGHDDTMSDDGTCISMMMSGLGGCRGNYTLNTRDEYLDLLFNM